VVEEWRKLHPEEAEAEDSGFAVLDESTVERIVEYQDKKAKVVETVLNELRGRSLLTRLRYTNKAIGELSDRRVDRAMKELTPETVAHVIAKTSFLKYLAGGAKILGRRDLGARLCNES